MPFRVNGLVKSNFAPSVCCAYATTPESNTAIPVTNKKRVCLIKILPPKTLVPRIIPLAFQRGRKEKEGCHHRGLCASVVSPLYISLGLRRTAAAAAALGRNTAEGNHGPAVCAGETSGPGVLGSVPCGIRCDGDLLVG